MDPSPAAARAARSVVARLGIPAEQVRVLHASNAVTLRVLPADLVARALPSPAPGLRDELRRAAALRDAGAPVAAPDPRVPPVVHAADGWSVSLWEHLQGPTAENLDPGEYAATLAALHAAMRELRVPAPHASTRVAAARRLLAAPDLTPELAPGDRAFLRDALDALESRVLGAGAPEQLLHGEPHPGNLLVTPDGPRVIDLETCCVGPVEFDLAHAPSAVAAAAHGVDRDLERSARALVLAMVVCWRYDRADCFPGGRAWRAERLAELRTRLG